MTRHYTIRTKYRIAIFLWFILGSGLLFGTYFSEYFFVPLFILFLISGVYTLLLRCPKCGKSVLNKPVRIFGTELYIWICWVPGKCSKCGTEFP